MNVRYWK